jgi:hypothetical protein
VEAVRGALDSWAATDIPGLQKWIATQPASPIADQARLSLGEVQLAQDPVTAMQTIEAISNAPRREEALVKFFRDWRKRDASAAQAWLQGGSAPAQLRARFVQR